MADYAKLLAAAQLLESQIRIMETTAKQCPKYLQDNNLNYSPDSIFEMSVIIRTRSKSVELLSKLYSTDSSKRLSEEDIPNIYLSTLEEYSEMLSSYLIKPRIYTAIIAQELNMPDLPHYFSQSGLSNKSLDNLKNVIVAIKNLY